MALFRIERQMPPVTDEDIDAAAYRARACLRRFPDVKWIRSFYDPATYHFTCYYEALDAEHIRQHSAMSQIPCDSIVEVKEYTPDMYT